MRILVNICRTVLGLTLMLSGFAKAVDPLGTQYKIDEYLGAIGLASLADGYTTLTASIILCALEFGLGLLLLLAIQQRLVAKTTILFMSIMTVVSIWLTIANPISDCGCFGDAIHLTNVQTLLKNIVLAALAIIVAWKSWNTTDTKAHWWKRWTFYGLMAVVLAVSAWGVYYLPIIDFRPFHIGASIREGITIPEGEKLPKLETTFIMEKNGQQQEFKLENYPDSTWTLVDTKTTVIEKGYEPPIHDFTITDHETGEDIEEQMLSNPGYTILLISPYLEKADDSNFGDINALYDYAKDKHWAFYCLTSSGDDSIAEWIDKTGAEYRFCMTDATTLKTMVRSNPGIILLKDGRVMGKWGRNNLPSISKLEKSKGKTQYKK